MIPTTVEWHAIATNDPRADGQFYYGVMSTGIFCRPSCKSRLPLRQNVQIFKTTTAAVRAGLRPCKRCRPTGQLVSPATWVTEIKTIIKHHYAEPLTLNDLAWLAHGAPYYLHHVFQRETGQTPLAYVQRVRFQHAQRLLRTTALPIQTVAQRCGFTSASYFSTQFKVVTGMTPRQFRQTVN
ncbi:helix-turn-helix domain-containing protein [Lactiplantibacillus garii]|uniref:Helix-turn-helix domain-containing protein n=1 Tax=Lactiplantibacillus garii TaxID=2306423 RepID=A0A3R8J8M0_9LACO|nr:bifunctional transcriptional activator/DNA repair enzyme AdaA [Lactiplantibacillus garii]RRK11354.1 helix-turn-helix domain-containing protein [Lactiplantibacillus garii]